MIVPNKLNIGDEVRVIAPSLSLSIMSKEDISIAKKRFEDMGLVLSFSKHAFEENDDFNKNITNKIFDLHEAFLDTNVKFVLCALGGFNSIELVNKIDYNLIKRNPKFFGGYSDISILNLAISQKTGIVTYHCPTFSSFAELYGFEYTLNSFKQTFIQGENESLLIEPSKTWSSDPYYLGQENRSFEDNMGYFVIQNGTANGTLLGGNISSIRLLYGTDYMPNFDKKPLILYIEDDSEVNKEFTTVEFNRNFESILLQPWFKQVRGIIIGRFEKIGNVDLRYLSRILLSKDLNVPIVANFDFGHTTPSFIIPNGLKADLDINSDNQVSFKINQI